MILEKFELVRIPHNDRGIGDVALAGVGQLPDFSDDIKKHTKIGDGEEMGTGQAVVTRVEETRTNRDVIKNFYERSALELGRVQVTIVERADGKGADSKPGWLGSISLLKRLLSGEIEESAVDTAAGKIPQYLVRASRRARIRCVDGRVIFGYDENRAILRNRELGPQGAGGTPGAAVCFILAEGPLSGSFEERTFEKDVDHFADDLKELNFEVGGHTDEHAHGDKTGCGAIDKMPEIVVAIADPQNYSRIECLTRAVMGDLYDDNAALMVIGNAVRVSSRAESYFAGFKPGLLDNLNRVTPNAVSKLVGKHNEIVAIVNRIFGYTFHRDEFSADSGHKLQAFNYDYWKSVEMVEAVISGSKRYGNLGHQQKTSLCKRVLTARVMYTIATLMTLTDGTINVVVLDELNEDEEPISLHQKIIDRKGSVPAEVRVG